MVNKFNILVVYYREKKILRKTIEDSIFAFGKYHLNDTNIFYYSYRPDIRIDSLLKNMKFDIVIFHSIFICQRRNWSRNEWKASLALFKALWKNAVKVLFAQDEQSYTNKIHDFIREVGVDILFTCANSEAFSSLYPRDKVMLKKKKQVFTGYIDYETFKKMKKIIKKEKIERTIHIGYRSDKTPYELGFQGRLKTLIPEVINKERMKYPNLKLDVLNTFGYKNAFLGMDWFRFLLKCQTVISCMGGASIQDPNGKIRKRVNEFMNRNPKATYRDIDIHILKKYGKPINYTAISPRHFEAAMTKTCQILVEGDYAGIFKPDINCIELKKDFSNLNEVFKKVENKKLCQKLADQAYIDIVKSGKYTYKHYVRQVLDIIKPFAKTQKINPFLILYTKLILGVNNFVIDKRVLVLD